MQWKVFSERIEKQPNEWSTYNFHTAAAFPHILPSHLWLFIWSHLIYIVRLQQATLYVLGLQLQIWGGLLKHLCEEQKLRRESEALKEEEAAAPEIYTTIGQV